MTTDPDGRGVVWLCHRCGARGGGRDRDSARLRHYASPRPAPIAAAPAAPVYWHTRDAPRATQVACEIWRTATALWDADAEPAAKYLRDARGIAPPYPQTLAYHRLRHPETRERAVPCLIVARHCPTVHMVRGVLRVFLSEDGRKYTAGTPKMSLGRIEGGRAELLTPDEDLAIAEGVESALSAWRLLRVAAWATCGAFPADMLLPDRVKRVVVVADHDASGGSEAKARILARSIRATGRSCVVIRPDQTGADANDVLRLRGSA